MHAYGLPRAPLKRHVPFSEHRDSGANPKPRHPLGHYHGGIKPTDNTKDLFESDEDDEIQVPDAYTKVVALPQAGRNTNTAKSPETTGISKQNVFSPLQTRGQRKFAKEACLMPDNDSNNPDKEEVNMSEETEIHEHQAFNVMTGNSDPGADVP
ncbi:predicted protein [Phaeodactylum tricornutum CCAP 1055/1]|uniref:Uncharacterized protein n=1 Tax=Phaeodactylum tricornutum (strain CCAP 1055/1) TaxID=556484 RepID=B7FXT0_PHATC|nr:predicted protein [Phaeodactylum tricornutum CCAP 1055/1]XP_002185103.1 predicted protein [Phaeodactylum tricornutum CCAP 1055/1]EEC43235.1 predicted protein [Phaeodactylum tricornutum CCAP 1055/1]EEC48805.1 predicted protein [Phaeodactylum tricornutum CCAP 1055/1]|eukprot:XP_002179819.1 predicted protein [Phaeodactylum tricornutum CCAP 1055/1]